MANSVAPDQTDGSALFAQLNLSEYLDSRIFMVQANVSLVVEVKKKKSERRKFHLCFCLKL